MKIRLLILFTLIMSGCTSQVWQAPSYEERVTGFYATQENALLLVTGQNYSYVFEASDLLIKSLKISRTIEFYPRYESFKLDKENNVSGKLELITHNTSDKQTLRELGFPQDEYGNIDLTFNLRGKRYKVEGNYPFQKLEDEHYVLVETPESGLSKAGKIVVTPGAVAIDTVAIVPVAAFFGVLGVMNELDL
ncbi:hypothetical protein AB4298_11085 [Shewanella sp. 10N.261.52.F9]|uniref:hypothetical protein n=1 Tax=Shewanella sp. 10N.261.52.F9 TaxID=3229684 RepID=UPI00354BF4A6